VILVVGGTGTVGRKVVEALLSNPQNQVRVLARGKSDWEGSVLPAFRRRGVETMVGDVRSKNTITKAVAGCKAIINCAGAMKSAPDVDLEEVNIDGVANLVELGQAAGVQRFIQLSCLGATEHTSSLYFQCKWDAEELVRKSPFYWTIFRPSLIFDSESFLFRVLDFWVQRSPLIFIVGSGLNRFQPIAAADVATCIVKSIYDRDTVGKTYELPGPETLDLETLLRKAAEQHGRAARTVRIPSFLGIPAAGLLGKLNPTNPIDNNVMSVMTSEMIGDDAPMLERFAIQRLSLENSLKRIGQTSKAASGSSQNKTEDSDEDSEQD
jgi:uncharacterized protein YbjT (DUF2867 family)